MAVIAKKKQTKRTNLRDEAEASPTGGETEQQATSTGKTPIEETSKEAECSRSRREQQQQSDWYRPFGDTNHNNQTIPR